MPSSPSPEALVGNLPIHGKNDPDQGWLEFSNLAHTQQGALKHDPARIYPAKRGPLSGGPVKRGSGTPLSGSPLSGVEHKKQQTVLILQNKAVSK